MGDRRHHLVIAVETLIALLSAITLTLTLSQPDWIEWLIGVDPDAHSGSLELAIAVAAALSMVGSSSAVTYALWRRRGAAAPA